MNTAVDFNNKGVTFLENDSLRDAMQMFQAALTVVFQLESTGELSSDSSIEHASTKLHERPKRSLPNLRKGEPDTFLYKKGVQAVPGKPKSTLSCIIMFNLALVHHLRSFEDPSSRTISLRKAMKLYLSAYEMGQSSDEEVSSIFFHVAMAVLNNAGQIQHEVGNFNKSRRYLDELQRLASSLPDSTYHQFNKERSDFILNASLLRPPSRAGAA